MKYLLLILVLTLVACGNDIECTNEKDCVIELKAKWPMEREKAKEDIQEEWERLDEKWIAEKNRREKNGEARQGSYYDKGLAQGSYAEASEPEKIESNGILQKGLTQTQVVEIYGEPEEWSERLGSGGEIWKYSRESGVCQESLKKWCAVYFDEFLRVEHQSNMLIGE